VAAPQEKLCHLESVYTNLIYETCALLSIKQYMVVIPYRRFGTHSRVKKSKKLEIGQAKIHLSLTLTLFWCFSKIVKGVMSIYPSVLPSAWNNSAPTTLIFMTFVVYFSKICRENSSLIKIWQEWRIFYMKIYVPLRYLTKFFLEWKTFQSKGAE
jgi:hypothetical protein